MSTHPFHDVCVAGVYNTRCARFLEGETALSLSIDAALGALNAAGLDRHVVDGVIGPMAPELIHLLGIGPAWMHGMGIGLTMIADAARAIACGAATTVLVVDAQAGAYTERAATAPWTRPAHEFVVSPGLYTAVEFALIARRHMHEYGTKPEHLAKVAATIRNNGHINPDAVYYGRGPYTIEDILASRMVADPFHLLDCAMTSEGGCGIVLTRADRAPDLRRPPAWILGECFDQMGPVYQMAPSWDLRSTRPNRPDPDPHVNGWVGRRAAEISFNMCGLTPNDVDVLELYDPFSFEIIRQLEAFGFCPEGEGGPFVMDGNIDIDGRFPVTTDGGLMAYNHSFTPQLMQRFSRCVEQIQGTCRTNQLANVDVAICSNSGAGALHDAVMLVGSERP